MSHEPKKQSRAWSDWVLAVVFVLYPLSIGPLAFLQGAGVLTPKTHERISPIYAPLTMMPPAIWVLLPYERQCDGLGRRFIGSHPQLPNPEAVILAIALVALTAWLIGRLRTSR